MRRWRVPLWLALVGLACVPTIGLLALSARSAFERAAAAREASAVAQEADHLGNLVALRFAVTREGFPLQALPAMRLYGIDERASQDLLGIDLRELATLAIADVERLAEKVSDPLVVQDIEALRPLRRQALDGEVDFAVIGPAYSKAETDLGNQIAAHVDSLRFRAVTTRSPRLASRLLVLADVLEAQRTGQATLGSLASLVLPEVAQFRQANALAGDWAQYERAAAAVDRDDLGDVEAVWQSFRHASDTLVFERTVTEALDRISRGQSAIDTRDFGTLATTFGAGLRRAEVLRSVGTGAVAAVRQEAEETASAAETQYKRTLAVAVAMVVLSLGSAMAVAALVVRPLRRLARAARAVSAGALDLPPLEEAGPREVAVVARAFDEMLANLRAVETQAGALAAGDLDASVLQHPVPGRLGDAVQASVAQLSSSLVERDRLQRRLAHEATHDALTGLPNRAAAVQALEEAVAAGRQTAVLFVDLDEFKRANDTHGHVVGDAVLRRVADLLRAQLRRTDRAARLGGDEFLIIADVVDHEEAVALGDRIVAAVSEPMVVEGVPVVIGASVGIAVADGGVTAVELLRDADVAVYEAKRAGKRRVEVLGDELRRRVADRADLERELRAAVAGGDVDLHFQPVVPLDGSPVAVVDALVRWTRPDGRALPAEAFVHVAEAADLAVALGTQVLERALTQLETWDAAGSPLAGLGVSLRMGPSELHDGSLPVRTAALLARHGIAAGRLTLEIPEATLVRDLGAAGPALSELRAIGCHVAVGGFGEGTTAISVLHLPVDVLKLDRTLVADLHDPRQRTLTELVVDAAHRLGVRVVASGVESGEQAALLADAGCDDAQGFWFVEPMPADAVGGWVAGRTRSGAVSAQ